MVAIAAGGIAASSASASSKAHTASKYNVVYIPGLTGNPFYSTVSCGASVEAKKLGVTFSTQGAPTFAVNAQTPVVNAVVARHPTAIMISNDDPKAMIPPLLKAQEAGQEMAKLTGGKAGTVLIEDNSPGYLVSEQRRDGLINYLKKHDSKVKILPIAYTNNSVSTAAADARAAASAHSDLIGVYTVETNNTQGALTGLQAAHLTGKVKLIGFDTSDPIVAGIKSGEVSADIVQYPYGEGMLGLKDAVMAAKGQKVPREQSEPFVVATKANINTAKVQQFIYKTSCSA
jgi:ribose transport system substrate-binding protein